MTRNNGAIAERADEVACVSGEEWLARAQLFELAAMGFLPTTDVLSAALVAGDYAAACAEAAAEAGLDDELDASALASYEGMDAETVFHELRRERTRLFVGERKPLITPYAGIRASEARGQRGVLAVGEESLAIEAFMLRCGVAKDLAAGQSNDPVDHIGTMCEFMQYLCLIAARAVQPPAGIEVSADDAIAFSELHFGPYARWCAERLCIEVRTPFYRFMATLLDYVSKPTLVV